jgi:hypothetical protein
MKQLRIDNQYKRWLDHIKDWCVSSSPIKDWQVLNAKVIEEGQDYWVTVERQGISLPTYIEAKARGAIQEYQDDTIMLVKGGFAEEHGLIKDED